MITRDHVKGPVEAANLIYGVIAEGSGIGLVTQLGKWRRRQGGTKGSEATARWLKDLERTWALTSDRPGFPSLLSHRPALGPWPSSLLHFSHLQKGGQ